MTALHAIAGLFRVTVAHGSPALPAGHRAVLRSLAIPAVAGFALLAFGLAWLQLWRIDRLGLLYDEVERVRSAAAAPQRVPTA